MLDELDIERRRSEAEASRSELCPNHLEDPKLAVAAGMVLVLVWALGWVLVAVVATGLVLGLQALGVY